MWLYVPSASAPEEPRDSNLDFESLADQLHRSVTWRGKKRLARLWLRALKTDRSTRLQYGRISQPSMQRRFEEWLTSVRRDCPASPTPSPENEKDIRTSAPSGPNSYEWWENASRDWFSSKMCLSFLSTFESSEKNYRSWATRLRSRCSSQLRTLELRTKGSESSYWPTANVPNGGRSSNITPHQADGSKRQVDLGALAKNWPSPRSEDAESCGNHPQATDSLTGVTKHWKTPHGMAGVDHTGKLGSGGEFHKQVMQWRTPDAPNQGGIRNRQNSVGEGHQTTIAEQAEMWQTPAADSFRSRGGDRVDEMGLDQQARFWGTPNSHERTHDPREVDHGTQLANQVSMWPSPQARDFRSGETQTDYGNSRPLNESVLAFSPSTSLPDLSPSVPTIQDGEKSSNGLHGSTRRLNPAFVAWLMGLPWWWTNPARINSGRSETESYLSRQRALLHSLCGRPDSRPLQSANAGKPLPVETSERSANT